MENDFNLNLVNFLQKENIDMNLSKISNSEFWLDNTDRSITVRIIIDDKTKKILYDVYSINSNMHLNEKTIKDVKTLEYIAEENREWNAAETIENIWLILDEITLWADKNNFDLREEKLL